MGSTNHSNIPVVGKTSTTLRTDGRRITSTISTSDVETVRVTQAMQPDQIMGSGSYVSGSTVQYFADAAYGLHKGGRSSTAAIPSKVNASRNLDVEKANTADLLEVIPAGQPVNVQYGIRQEGHMLTNTLSITDVVVERIQNSGIL